MYIQIKMLLAYMPWELQLKLIINVDVNIKTNNCNK